MCTTRGVDYKRFRTWMSKSQGLMELSYVWREFICSLIRQRIVYSLVNHCEKSHLCHRWKICVISIALVIYLMQKCPQHHLITLLWMTYFIKLHSIYHPCMYDKSVQLACHKKLWWNMLTNTRHLVFYLHHHQWIN